jgi:bifunctional DNA-binding transcriptional regulator/antitoxin component of YhaV-PrlF toxin-antitoxin module
MEEINMFKKLNMSRKVDTLGRVVIPKSVRDELNI